MWGCFCVCSLFLGFEPVRVRVTGRGACSSLINRAMPVHKMYTFMNKCSYRVCIGLFCGGGGVLFGVVSPSMSPPVPRKIPRWVVSLNRGRFQVQDPIPLVFQEI